MARARFPYLFFACALAFGLSAAAAPPAPRQAPDCALRPLAGEGTRTLREFAGRFVWVDFWASWCGSCAESFPFLDGMARDLGARGLAVVGVNVGDSRDAALAFLAEHPVAFVQLADADGACPRHFGVEGMPSGYLIDPRGEIVLESRGFRPGEAVALRARIEGLLADETPAVAAPAP